MDGEKAKRYGGQTMLIPTPMQVKEAIEAIPEGSTKTIRDLRNELAQANGADVTCPLCAGIFWRIVAEAAEEDRQDGLSPISPYWRVTADGKPNPKLPGGFDRQIELLRSEGVELTLGRRRG